MIPERLKPFFCLVFFLFFFLSYGYTQSEDSLVSFEILESENGRIEVRMTSDTTFESPFNTVSSAQITIKAPAGALSVSGLRSEIDNVFFIMGGMVSQPAEAPGFDYFSIILGSPTTTDIPFQKDQTVTLFSFENGQDCSAGFITLMSDTDPFFGDNQSNFNGGQQLSVAGFMMPDIPIEITGNGINCNPDDGGAPTPADTLDLQIAIQSVSCNGEADGRINIKTEGAAGSYDIIWNTGDTTLTISDLTGGSYSYTITDNNGNTYSDTVEVPVPEALIVTVNTVDNTDSVNANGMAIAIVSGGIPPYRYEWSSGSDATTDTAISGLAPGNYELTVVDNHGCEEVQNFVINDSACEDIDVMLDILAPVCIGDSTGSLKVTPLTGTSPYRFLWQNGATTDSLANLPSGVYQVTILDANNCSMVVAAEVPQPPAIEVFLAVSNEINGGRIAANISGGLPPYIYAWSNGGDGPVISELTPGNYTLTLTDDNGCEIIQSANVPDPECDMDLFGELGNAVMLDSVACDESGELCLPFSLDSLNFYDLILNGTIVNQEVAGCNADTLYAYTLFNLLNTTPSGPYILERWVLNGMEYSGTFENIPELVDSMNVWDIQGTWNYQSDIGILDGGFNGNTYGSMVITSEIFNTTTRLDVNTRLTNTGTEITFPTGTHLLIMLHRSSGCADTLQIVLPCANEMEENCLSFIETDTLTVSLAGCQPFELCVPIPFDSASNYTFTDNGEMISTGAACDNGNGTLFTFDTPDRHQLVVTNTANCRDTILIAAHAPDCDENYVITDTIEVGDTDRACLELIGLPGPFASIEDICSEKNGSFANITIDGLTGCIDYTGVEEGRDTACLQVCDVFGFCDTIPVYLTVINAMTPPPAPDAVDDIISTTLDESVVINILANDVFTSLDTVYVVSTPENGIAVLNPDGTITFTPDTGYCNDDMPDVFEYAICEDTLCDTAFVEILIVCDKDSLIQANNDTATTFTDEPVVINVLGNDIYEILDDFQILTQPQNGTAVFNIDGTVSYMPSPGYCNDAVPDSFTYVICQRTLCDTATVLVMVSCSEETPFRIYPGFSPNGDGINDTWQIDGIENYPDNEVKVYSRWGNLVYEMKGYKNEWDGRWGNSMDFLPDGTYFYLVDIGEPEVFSGYLVIRR